MTSASLTMWWSMADVNVSENITQENNLIRLDVNICTILQLLISVKIKNIDITYMQL